MIIKEDLLALLIAFFISFLFAFPIIKYLKKMKLKQTILDYVDLHKGKQGTPTMGGLIFLFGLLVVYLIFCDTQYKLSLMTIAVTFGFALIGFLDDFIKVKYKRNLGLTPLQKIIGQGGLSFICGLFVYKSNIIPSSIILPFSFYEIEIGAWIIPIVMFVFIALVNAVNLTDGLDGLAGKVGLVYIGVFAIVLYIFTKAMYLSGYSMNYIDELSELNSLNFIMIGCLLAYLIFNVNKAKIFMGDIGSLALGGFICCVSVFSGLTFYIPIIGILFVVSAVSVIVQVCYYKITNKRVFKMAPLHHHFEKCGINESKIVSLYTIIGILVGVVSIYLSL